MSSRTQSTRKSSTTKEYKRPVQKAKNESVDISDDEVEVRQDVRKRSPVKQVKSSLKKSSPLPDNVLSDSDEVEVSSIAEKKDNTFVHRNPTSRIKPAVRKNEVQGVTTRSSSARISKRQPSESNEERDNTDDSMPASIVPKKLKFDREVSDTPNSVIPKGKGKRVRDETPEKNIEWSDSEKDGGDVKRAKKLSRKEYLNQQALDSGVRPMPTKADLDLVAPQGYLEDYEGFKVTKLPKTCEVFFEEMQDKRLIRSYKNLPPLKLGKLLFWSSNGGIMDDFVQYSAWQMSCPSMDISRRSVLMRAVTFQSYKHFINPSRVDPTYVRLHTPFASNRGQLYVDKKLAMCLSVGLATESYLINGKPDKKVNQKQIVVMLHTQEGDRYGAFVCMVFNADQNQMVAQVSKTGIAFSTMSQAVQKAQPPSSMLSPTKSPLAARIAQKAATSGNASSSRARTALDFEEHVPVYDGRAIDFNFEEDIENIAEVLPSYPEEVPYGSCVVVAHSLTAYRKNRMDHLSANVQWVIILGIPPA